MKLNISWQKLLPHLGIVVLFVIISLIYCSPIFEGKKLVSNDVLQAQGNAQEAKEYKEKTGEQIFWTNSLFSGMPAVLVSADYPMSLTTSLGRFVVNILPYPANLFFLYFVGAYLMFVMLGYNLIPSTLGAVAFALGSYNIINIEAGHISKVWALGFTPPLIGAVVMAYRGKWLLGSALAGLFAGLQLYANHVQITYYVGITLVVLVIFIFIEKIIKKEPLKPFLITSFALLLMGGIALGSHASRLLVTNEYTKSSIRGKAELSSNKESKGGTDRDYAFQWSYGIGETFTFLVPNFVGGGSGTGKELSESSHVVQTLQEYQIPAEAKGQMQMYWGDQPFTSGPAYLGAVLVFLMLFGVLYSGDKLKWGILSIIILLTMMAWGKNFSIFNYALFDFMPLYNKFRAHTMTLSLLQIFVAWLAVLGLQDLLKKEINTKKLMNSLKISGGVVAGLCLIIALLGGIFSDFKPSTQKIKQGNEEVKVNADEEFKQRLMQQMGGEKAQAPANSILTAIRKDRANMQSSDAFRSFIFVALAVSLMWIVIAQKQPLQYAAGGLIVLTLIDLWGVDARYLNQESFKSATEEEQIFEMSDAEKNMKAKEKDLHYRVFNLTTSPFNDAFTSYNHKSIGGYHGAKMRRYQDLIENQLGKSNIGVINMLNTKYILQTDQKGAVVASKNPEACGNAWFVPNYQIVENADKELKALDKFNPKEIAYIDKKFENQLKDLKINFDSTATIRLVKYSPDKMEYESNAKTEQLAIFSEIYYVQKDKMEWTAYIDGKKVEHLRANYVLRALRVPAGKHKIEFKFDVPIYKTGEMIALICSILLFALLGFATWKSLFVIENKNN
jgi:hypothetical protein